MILKATLLGKHLAQHPFHQIQLLDAGIEFTGPSDDLVIAFNQIVNFSCKRGIIWGEIEFILVDDQKVSLHGTEWQATQAFYDALLNKWQRWSREMVTFTTSQLENQILAINELSQRNCWLPQKAFLKLAKDVETTYESLPIPEERIAEFKGLVELDYLLQQWHYEGVQRWHEHNNEWVIKIQKEHSQFFQRFPLQLDISQYYVVLQQEPAMLVLGAPGSGKSTSLIARASWLLYQHELVLDNQQPLCLPLLPDNILLLGADLQTQSRLNEIRTQFQNKSVNQLLLLTPYDLAYYLLKQTTKKILNQFSLLADTFQREQWLLETWQNLCSTKKTFAKLWRKWLSEQYEWELISGDFWLEDEIAVRMGPRLDRWLKHIRFEKANKTAIEALAVLAESKQSQASAINQAANDLNNTELAVSEQHIHLLQAPDDDIVATERKLFAPILKAWKDKIKAEQAIDEPDAILQAIKAVGRTKFVTPWRHILVDNYQEFSLLARLLLKGLSEKSVGAQFVYFADDAQILTVGQNLEAIDEFIDSAKKDPGQHIVYELEHDYRLPSEVRKLTDTFIRQNPQQQIKPQLEVPKQGGTISGFASRLMSPKHKNTIYTAKESLIISLIDRLTSFAPKGSTILLTALYLYQIPNDIEMIKNKWPHFNFVIKPFYLLHGVETDYAFIFGLQQYGDSFPAFIRDTALEKFLLPEMETFLDAEMRRWFYTAMTRARQSTWLIHDDEKPSIFVNEMIKYGAQKVE